MYPLCTSSTALYFMHNFLSSNISYLCTQYSCNQNYITFFFYSGLILTHYDRNCILVFATLKTATSGQNMLDDTMY